MKKQKLFQQILIKKKKKKHNLCKTGNFYILHEFSLITIASLIAVSVYYYLINVEQNKNINYHFTSQIMN